MTIAEILSEVTVALQGCSIPYVIGGSFASSAWGHPRQTNDVDIEVLITEETWGCLLGRLGHEYLANTAEFQVSIRDHSEYRTAQLLHREEAFKIDLFLLHDDEYTRSELARGVTAAIGEARLRLLAPENIVLQKLRWFRAGGEVSDRQMNDVIQVLETQDNALDWTYLEHWASHFRVDDLLTTAVQQF